MIFSYLDEVYLPSLPKPREVLLVEDPEGSDSRRIEPKLRAGRRLILRHSPIRNRRPAE